MRGPVGLVLLAALAVVPALRPPEQAPVPRADPGARDAEAWLASLDAELGRLNAAAAAVTWHLAVGQGRGLAALAGRLAERQAAWRSRRCARAPALASLDAAGRRQVYLLCRGPALTPASARQLTVAAGRQMEVYSSGRVCRRHKEPCYSGEPDLERLMKRSRDPAELLWGWQQWRRAVGPPALRPFLVTMALQNQAARANGYADMGEVWREELETPHLEDLVDELYHQVEPLYKLLHAYVRHCLVRYYGDQLVDPRGPIPAHLLGDMWAQNWAALGDVLAAPRLDLTAALRHRNYTVEAMARHAEDFYTSLGLDAMTPTFWRQSQLRAPPGSNTTCHGTAANMFRPGDYRRVPVP
ncbi:angiotensin-converting enzyme-like [Bacillus rossius redtenbacheri]|uniref:angiotensin-converting enzyme-like n=1 Tax=Bacillus rossius redtenbacheri TaxID=93214 RepID=UPI002FDC9D3F